MTDLNPEAAALRDRAIAPVLEALEIEQRLDAVAMEHSRSIHPSSLIFVGFEELRPGMGFHRPDGVWIVVTKRSDGLMLCRREADNAQEWIDSDQQQWPQADSF